MSGNPVEELMRCSVIKIIIIYCHLIHDIRRVSIVNGCVITIDNRTEISSFSLHANRPLNACIVAAGRRGQSRRCPHFRIIWNAAVIKITAHHWRAHMVRGGMGSQNGIKKTCNTSSSSIICSP